MVTSLQTKPGTRKLSEVTRKLVAPSGIVSTGWPAVQATCEQKLGISFDDWQNAAGRLILAKRQDGKLAVMIGGVGMSVCRQVGKTYLFGGMFFGLAVNHPGMLMIWSAHHARTHGETFLSMQAFAQRRRIAPYVQAIYKGSGDEEIRFVNGSRILFGARERGFGRGIPGVDAIMADEGQIMSEKALDAQLATLNTSQFGLFASVGTPPRPDDPSESFTRMRTEAWAGTLEDAAWIEIGAEPGTDPHDRRRWSKWNPSHPKRTPAESILRLQRKLSEESFRREGMGTWDSDDMLDVFGPGNWAAAEKSSLKPPNAGMVLGVGVSVDQAWSSVALAAPMRGGKIMVGANRREAGTDWLVGHVAQVYHRRRCPVVVDAGGPGAHLIQGLRDKRVRVIEYKTADVLDACAGIYEGVRDGRVFHPNHPELDDAVKVAVKRDIGDRWAWGRRKSTGDVSMLEGATLAFGEVRRRGNYDVLKSIL